MHGDYKDREYFKKRAAKAGVENIPWVKKVINSPLLLKNPRIRQKLERFLDMKIQQNVKEDHPFAIPSREETGKGDYELVKVVTGKGPEYTAKVAKNDTTEHGLIAGPSGAGKTTWLVNLAQQIHRTGLNTATGKREVAAWVFCTEGQMPAYMAASGARGCEDFLIIDVPKVFRFNRYKAPPGIEPRRHIAKLVSQDRECKYYRDFIANDVKNACYELLNRQGVFNERQLLEYVIAKKFKPGSRPAMSQQSVVNRLTASLEYMGSVYDVKRSHDLAALTERSVVWMLNGLSSDDIITFVGDLILWLKQYLPVCYQPTLKLVLIMDELTHISSIDRCRRADIQEAFLLDAVRTFRKRAVSFMFGTQSVYTVPNVVLSNLACFWLAYRPTEGYSMRILSENLALDRDQASYMMQMPNRYVACRTKDYPAAFLGSVGEINLPIATEKEIAERMKETQRVLDSLLEPEPDDSPSLFSEDLSVDRLDALFTNYKLTKAHLDFMELIITNPFLPVSRLNEICPYTSYKADSLRQQLADTGPGLLRTHRITTGKKGGPLSVVVLTDAGLRIIEKLNIKHPQPLGHGGVEHKFWAYAAHRWAVGEKGYPAKIEKWLNGKSVDVGVEWDEKKVALEIALEGMEKEISNLIKDLEAGWDQVIFCSLTQKEQNLLKNEIAQRFGSDLLESGKVGFMKLSTFLECKEYQSKAKSKPEETEE
jgi:energy-coupling factor transporter ATP-binding protein EcfA2